MEEEHFAFESYRFLFSPKVTDFLGPYPQCYVLDLGSVGQPVWLELRFSLLPPPILPATVGSSRQRWACSALWGGEAIFLWGSTGQGSGWRSQSLLLIPSLNDAPKDNPYLLRNVVFSHLLGAPSVPITVLPKHLTFGLPHIPHNGWWERTFI